MGEEKWECAQGNPSQEIKLVVKNWPGLLYKSRLSSTADCLCLPTAGEFCVERPRLLPEWCVQYTPPLKEPCLGNTWLLTQKWERAGGRIHSNQLRRKRTHVISGQKTSCPQHLVSPGRWEGSAWLVACWTGHDRTEELNATLTVTPHWPSPMGQEGGFTIHSIRSNSPYWNT